MTLSKLEFNSGYNDRLSVQNALTHHFASLYIPDFNTGFHNSLLLIYNTTVDR